MGTALRRDERLIELGAHQRPRAETHVAPIGSAAGWLEGGHGRHGTGGVMGAGHDDPHARQARLRGHLRAERPEVGAGLHERSEEMPRKSEPIKHVEGPVAAAGVETLRGRGVRPLVGSLPRQQPVKEVGDHQESVGCRQHGRVLPFQGKQLIERVQLHELQAGGREDLVAGHDRLGGSEHSLGTGIAVADGIGQQRAVGRQEGEVNAPGIDADAPHRAAMADCGGPQAGDHLLPQPHQIPDEFAPHRDRSVLEAVNLFQFQQPAVESPRHDPPAGGAQIDRQCHRSRHA